MYCQNCGKQLESIGEYCQYCGSATGAFQKNSHPHTFGENCVQIVHGKVIKSPLYLFSAICLTIAMSIMAYICLLFGILVITYISSRIFADRSETLMAIRILWYGFNITIFSASSIVAIVGIWLTRANISHCDGIKVSGLKSLRISIWLGMIGIISSIIAFFEFLIDPNITFNFVEWFKMFDFLGFPVMLLYLFIVLFVSIKDIIYNLKVGSYERNISKALPIFCFITMIWMLYFIVKYLCLGGVFKLSIFSVGYFFAILALGAFGALIWKYIKSMKMSVVENEE